MVKRTFWSLSALMFHLCLNLARLDRRFAHLAGTFSPSRVCRWSFMEALLSFFACSLTEFVSRLSAALMNVHDLPAAIRVMSRSFSSNVQRILGIYAVISSPSALARLTQAFRKPVYLRKPGQCLRMEILENK